MQPDISPLLAAMKKALGDRVSDVRATARLTDSAVVLAAGEHGPGPADAAADAPRRPRDDAG